MLHALYRPVRDGTLVVVALGILAATAAYCLLYTALAGRSESLAAALVWAMVNVVPWYVAFEAAKRVEGTLRVVAVVSAAFAVSLLLQVAIYGIPSTPGFEVVRRLPYVAAVLLLVLTGRLVVAAKAAHTTGSSALPLAPRTVDWVSAAGNYVELWTQGRAVLHRASLNAVGAELERHGFVRIHRSTIVRREAIHRVRPNDVVLRDGTNLRLGKRYRTNLG